ncbi:HAD-IA family hydrolase [Kordiimonas lacus]|uniref:Phosphoglycolate phosphatase n=1 Tax=Kordiimonas lacus TaxID=637679 RepID=A0A1G7C0I7_9PROT|nr:HAD-IA family hydrolase [Kordiimonas lacus]SDE32797.1 phosphoglycolate phosphatase [Kordiimonas lacus]
MNKLVIFDCDGTLVDSQHMIVGTMHETFEELGLPVLTDAEVRAIVGLSLVEAMAALLPEAERAFHELATEKYKANFYKRRVEQAAGPDPLYPGTLEVLESLNADGYVLGVATGNSVRGLERVLKEHSIGHHFVTLQTADGHPSKPHPSMIHTAIAEAGSHADQTVMIGDTSFDMMMARNAPCGGIGVDWGYHHTDELTGAGAAHVATSFYDIPKAVKALIG